MDVPRWRDGKMGSRCGLRVMSVSVRTVCQGGLHMQEKCPGRVLFTVYFTGKANC